MMRMEDEIAGKAFPSSGRPFLDPALLFPKPCFCPFEAGHRLFLDDEPPCVGCILADATELAADEPCSMTCEKQFLPANNTFLYCSEACRVHDQAPSQPVRSHSYSSSPPLTPYTRQFSSYPSTTTYEDGPDIIPRFSPTQSRPRSYFNSDPYPQAQSYQPTSTEYSTSPQQTQYHHSSSSTALASLRELATALPKISKSSRNRDPESPPKSNASSITRTGSGVWDYIPFASSSKTASPTPNATPGNSYTNTNGGGYAVSQSYGIAGRSKEDLYAYGNGAGYGYGKSHGTGVYGNTGGMGMDRPLPPRTASHRPKSVDLVTPFSGH
ncbi:hypothetical protein ONS95_010009 [Cadophora gregata]|uniref:uncharacterized protein n=1 Tax=Cadophora gregata TaxID=51156 RepID=UPI0026DC7CA8|nr:uncharacterized protein ONS95_010009 [Cadophora gregata]KAK0121723.1 hypothetical protein ONS95_010009 [Cadophora gregata]